MRRCLDAFGGRRRGVARNGRTKAQRPLGGFFWLGRILLRIGQVGRHDLERFQHVGRHAFAKGQGHDLEA